MLIWVKVVSSEVRDHLQSPCADDIFEVFPVSVILSLLVFNEIDWEGVT